MTGICSIQDCNEPHSRHGFCITHRMMLKPPQEFILPEEKLCANCYRTKPLEEFYKYSASKDGRQHYCRECAKSKAKGNYTLNREARIEIVRNWQLQHPEYGNESNKRSYHRNPAPQKARSVAGKLKRRALLLGREVEHGITVDKVYELCNGICFICWQPCNREDASVDHELPISLGGNHTWENVQLAHLVCNKRKGNRI